MNEELNSSAALAETATPAVDPNKVLDGTDLILSLDGKALGFSTGCKISTTAETGERLTKESSGGKWKEKYVKNFSQEITADGCVLATPDDSRPTYVQIMTLMAKGLPVTATYSVRREGREGSDKNYYGGQYIITSCELDGQAGEDAKYSIKLENVGKIDRVDGGLA